MKQTPKQFPPPEEMPPFIAGQNDMYNMPQGIARQDTKRSQKSQKNKK